MEKEWGNGERFTLYISSFSLYFLPLYPFPVSKIVSFCRKILNTALLSRMSQKNLTYMRYEKIILGRIRCEKAPQVVPAWCGLDSTAVSIFAVILVELTIQLISLQILRRQCCLVWTAKKVYWSSFPMTAVREASLENFFLLFSKYLAFWEHI